MGEERSFDHSEQYLQLYTSVSQAAPVEAVGFMESDCKWELGDCGSNEVYNTSWIQSVVYAVLQDFVSYWFTFVFAHDWNLLLPFFSSEVQDLDLDRASSGVTKLFVF